MEVFWSKGYEGAQLVDLTKAMGISPPSFYAAFGTKEEAFCEAVDLYIRTVGAHPMQALERARTLKAGLRTMLERSIDVALSSDTRGCMLILGVVNVLPETSGACAYLKNARRTTHALLEKRIRRAVEEGELSPDSNPAALADFYHGILQAISFQARDGATRAQLRRLIVPALAAIANDAK